MKKLRILPLFLSLLCLLGCDLIDKIKGLETIEIAVALSDDYPVHISETDPLDFQFTDYLTTENNPDLVEYINDVENYDLISATLSVSSWTLGDEDITFSGTVTLGPYEESITNLNPYDYFISGNEYFLQLDNDDLHAINEDLNADNQIKYSIDGVASGKPVQFVITAILDMNVEVKTKL
jgi:hypothetical protein